MALPRESLKRHSLRCFSTAGVGNTPGHLSKTNEVKVSVELRHDSSFLRCSLSLSTGVGNTPGPPESETKEVKVSVELRHDSSFLRCSLSLSTGVGNTPGPPE